MPEVIRRNFGERGVGGGQEVAQLGLYPCDLCREQRMGIDGRCCGRRRGRDVRLGWTSARRLRGLRKGTDGVFSTRQSRIFSRHAYARRHSRPRPTRHPRFNVRRSTTTTATTATDSKLIPAGIFRIFFPRYPYFPRTTHTLRHVLTTVGRRIRQRRNTQGFRSVSNDARLKHTSGRTSHPIMVTPYYNTSRQPHPSSPTSTSANKVRSTLGSPR